jgi:hypothetical protein
MQRVLSGRSVTKDKVQQIVQEQQLLQHGQMQLRIVADYLLLVKLGDSLPSTS